MTAAERLTFGLLVVAVLKALLARCNMPSLRGRKPLKMGCFADHCLALEIPTPSLILKSSTSLLSSHQNADLSECQPKLFSLNRLLY